MGKFLYVVTENRSVYEIFQKENYWSFHCFSTYPNGKGEFFIGRWFKIKPLVIEKGLPLLFFPTDTEQNWPRYSRRLITSPVTHIHIIHSC